MRPPTWRTREICFVVFDDVLLIDVVGPSDVFGRANTLLVRTGQPERYRITVLSTFGGEIRAAGGLRLQTAALPAPAICAFDTLLVAGGPGVHTARRNLHLLNWLRAVEPSVQRIGSVCTGAYVVAEAGLLTGRSATTHWRYEEDFAAQFPQVRLNIDAMFVRDGKLFSSAGGAAGIDLALSLVDEDFGRDLAAEIASELVVSNVRAAGQTQHSAALAAYGSRSDKVRRATGFILSQLESGVTVEQVAEHVGLSTRQLLRQFVASLHVTPAHYIATARVQLARELVSGTRQPMEKIALRCGFSGREQLKRVFRKATGSTPEEFRADHGGGMPSDRAD